MEIMSNEEYRKIDAISSSDVKSFLSAASEKHWNYNRLNQKDRDAFRFGRVLHEMIIEDKEPLVFHAPINQKTGEEYGANTKKMEDAKNLFKQENQNQDFLSVSEYAAAIAMKESVYQKTQLFNGKGYNEFSFFADCDETGLKLKCRPDRIKGMVMIDLKTIDKIQDFEKHIEKLLYFVQASFYLDVFEKSTGKKINKFCFVFVEKVPPFDCVVCVLSSDYIEAGRQLYKKALIDIKNCTSLGRYRGIMKDKEFIEIEPTNWTLRRVYEEV